MYRKGNTVKGRRNLFCKVAWSNAIIGQLLVIGYTVFVDYTNKSCCKVVFDLGVITGFKKANHHGITEEIKSVATKLDKELV